MAGKKTGWSRGSISLKRKRIWVFRYVDEHGKYRAVPFSTIRECRTSTQARIEADRQRLPEKYVTPARAAAEGRKTFDQLVARYQAEKIPARFSTHHGYESWLRLHIAPQWGAKFIEDVRPAAVEDWLKDLSLAPKSKSHIKGLMVILFKHAMKWEWIPVDFNPMKLVEVKGGSKRQARPSILSPEQFAAFLLKIEEEHVKVISLVSMCLGLRFSEVLAFKWSDIDWDNETIHVRRGIVLGRVDEVKTEYSEAELALDGDLAEILLEWREKTDFAADDHWIFASPFQAGENPYFPTAVRRKIHTAAKAAGLGELFAGEPTKIMRHSYRSWLGTTNTPLAVIKDLMRHSDIRTTMNDYGNGMQKAMRKAHGKVVQMVLKPKMGGARAGSGAKTHGKSGVKLGSK